MTSHEFARELRSHQTTAEERLWYYLRAHRFMGLKFKRQQPVGPYIADFICMEYKLIVEADGGQHGSLGDFDRDVWLSEQGYTVLRFWNNQIQGEIEAVLETIRQAVLAKGFVESPALSPDPSPVNGRGEKPIAGSNATGSLPSPACGRGAGGEGQRVKMPPRSSP
ncbi:endonuclease domain-containing protein [Cupriavidus sp. BIS7]|uniref:endonuclease domain-containing protein n=1 Tax=Cupriavidus sp. BIS7 TaxID=1217718 RepID=UPI0003694B0D|nr:endonuclease domain-containing protein [Cupriavidus sp. BIS7]